MIGQVGQVITPDNLQAIVSLVVSRLSQHIEDYISPTKITTVDKLKFEITRMIQSNGRFFEGMLGWEKDLPKKNITCN